ncbi:MAG: FtsW/RodA/SpoVE family cell cycle protein [Planctomycetes bacterium]|nr:FtsW/RodA/SpoVE family cell cycle protein [Planctomycetota bacterium]
MSHTRPESASKAAWAVLGTVLALMAFGLLVQISHASTTLPKAAFGHEVRNLVGMRLAGLFVLGVAAWMGPRGIERFLPWITGAVLILLVLVFLPGFQSQINGSRRWVQLPGFPMTLQPSELARVVGVLWVAWRCALLGDGVQDARRGYLPMLAMAGLFAGLILAEPDLGGALLFLVCYLSVLFVGGARWTHMGLSACALLAGSLVVAATAFHYVRERLAIWMGDSTNDQVRRAMEAIASGDGLGVGIGQGGFRNQSLQYMQTDYVFSMVGEEFGLLGSALVIGLFLALLFHGLRMVRAIPDRFSALAAFGLLVSVVVQAMLHLQVVTGLAPPKGMNLPFVSDGGSALLATCLAVGIALGAARGHGVPRGSLSNTPASPKKS